MLRKAKGIWKTFCCRINLIVKSSILLLNFSTMKCNILAIIRRRADPRIEWHRWWKADITSMISTCRFANLWKALIKFWLKVKGPPRGSAWGFWCRNFRKRNWVTRNLLKEVLANWWIFLWFDYHTDILHYFFGQMFRFIIIGC